MLAIRVSALALSGPDGEVELTDGWQRIERFLVIEINDSVLVGTSRRGRDGAGN